MMTGQVGSFAILNQLLYLACQYQITGAVMHHLVKCCIPTVFLPICTLAFINSYFCLLIATCIA